MQSYLVETDGLRFLHMQCSRNDGSFLATCQRSADWEIFVAVVVTTVGAGLGGFCATNELRCWYAAIRKPKWTPPNRVFGPVWIALYILQIAAYAIVLQAICTYKYSRSGCCGDASLDAKHTPPLNFGQDVVYRFWIEHASTLLWPFLFFGAHRLTLSAILAIAIAYLHLAFLVSATQLTHLAAANSNNANNNKSLYVYMTWIVPLILTPGAIWKTYAAALSTFIALRNQTTPSPSVL